MKRNLKLRNLNQEIISAGALLLSSLIMLIENLVVSGNEALAVGLYVSAFAFAAFSMAVRAGTALLDRRISDDLLVCIASFGAFLLGYYQTAVLCALIYEYLQIIIIFIKCRMFGSLHSDCVKIFDNAKQTVRLSSLRAEDNIFIHSGDAPLIDCEDHVTGERLDPLEPLPRDTVAIVLSRCRVYEEYDFKQSELDICRRVAFMISLAFVIVFSAVIMIVGFTTDTAELSVYKLLSAFVCIPYCALSFGFSAKRADIAYIVAYLVVCLTLVSLIFFGALPMWIAVLIKCVLQTAAEIFCFYKSKL